MGKLSTFIINGAPMSGKDTFVRQLQKEFPDQVVNFSTIDSVKELYKVAGWDGKKDAESRKVLSDMKDYLTKKIDLPFLEVQSKISETLKTASNSEKDMMLFIHVREPQEIDRLKKAHPDIVTIQVVRNCIKDLPASNHADANINDYQYDITVYNNETVKDLRNRALVLAAEHGLKKAEPKRVSIEFEVPEGMNEKEFEQMMKYASHMLVMPPSTPLDIILKNLH